MQALTPAGQTAVSAIAQRHGFSEAATRAMLDGMAPSGGNMAQFSHPEFGGMGQWMRNGMIMLGDMFNNNLKSRVDGLCHDLAALLANGDVLQPPSAAASAAALGQSGNWWPAELGYPSSTGSQNEARYAYFAQTRRLAIETHGRLTIYDTGDHQIGGVSQQQSYGHSLQFTSQYGLVDVSTLPVVTPL